MPRMVDVGIKISAIDSTRRAINSARRGFSQLRADFSSINPARMTGSVNTGFRSIRQQVLRTAGVTRTWLSVTMRGADVIGTRTLPKMRRQIKATGNQMETSSKQMVKGGKEIGQALASNLLTMGLYSTSVISLGRNMMKATLEMDQYVRGFKAVDGGQREAMTTMQEIIKLAKQPGVNIPGAARSYMNLRSVGVSNRFAQQTIEEYANAIAIAGGKADDLRESVRQMSQTLSINKIDMENWRVILERLPTMRTAIQKTFGPESIHTTELNKVLKQRGISVQDAWSKILDQMMMQERVDPNTITNIVERVENSIWELSANIGKTYEPTIMNILRGAEKLIDNFNAMSQPMREFIAFLTTSVGLLGAIGASLWVVGRVFGGMKRLYQGAKGMGARFLDKPIYSRDGGVLSKSMMAKHGDVPDLTPRQLLAGQIKDPDGFKSELQQEVDNAEKLNRESQDAYNKLHDNYDDMKQHSRILVRQDYMKQMRENLLQERVDRDVAAEVSRYEAELEDVSNRIHSERMKIESHNMTLSKELDALRANMISTEDAYGKAFEQEFRSRRERYIQTQLEPTRQNLISTAVTKYKKQLQDDLKEAEKKLSSMKEDASQYGAHSREVRRIKRLLEPHKPYTKDDMEFHKLRTEYLNDLKQQRRSEIIDAEMQAGGVAYPKRFTRKDGTVNEQGLRSYLMGLKRYKDQVEISAEELLSLEDRVLRDLEIRRDEAGETLESYRAQINRQYADVSKIKLSKEKIREINDQVRGELEKEFDSERRKLKEIQDNYYNALVRGDKQALAKYEQERIRLTQDYFNRMDRVRRQSEKAQRPLVDESVKRATILGPDGLPIFHDQEIERDVQARERRAQADIAQQRRGARRDLRTSQGLLARATANLKSINHLGFLTEIAYESAIFGAIGLVGLGVVKLTTHFQQLYKQTDYFKDYLDSAVPSLVKWEKGFQEWRQATFSVRHEFERLTPAMRRGIKAQIDFLEAQERAGPLREEDINSLTRLRKEWVSGKRELDEYAKSYFEFLQRSRAKELLDVGVGAEISAGYGQSVKALDEEIKKARSGLFRDVKLTPEQWKSLSDSYVQMMEARGKYLKLEGQEVGFFGEASFAIYRQSEINKMRTELREQFAGLVYGEDSKEQRLLGERTPEAVRVGQRLENILDLMAKRNLLAKKYTDFEKDRNRVAKEQEKAITTAPRFEFADNIQRWGIAVGDANQQLSRLRDTFLQVNPAMQGFYKTQMSFYESVKNLEESTSKSVTTSFGKYRDALDILQLNEFLHQNRGKYKNVVNKSVMEVLRGDADDSTTREVLRERARILEIVGNQQFNAYIDKINVDSLEKNRQSVAELLKQYQDATAEFAKSMGDIRQRTLKDMRLDVQSTFRDDLEAGARPYVRLQVLEGYIERLRALQGRQSDASGRQGYQNAINDAVKEAEDMRQEIGRRTAQNLSIRQLMEQSHGRQFGRTHLLPGGLLDFGMMLGRILGSEGGYDARDKRRGGLSYAGITQTTYDAFRSGRTDIPAIVKDLKGRDDVISEFYRWYFEQHGVNEIPKFLRYMYADYAVNAGNQAMKTVQKLLDVRQTGGLNDETRQALERVEGLDKEAAKAFLQQFTNERNKFYATRRNRKGISEELRQYYINSERGWFRRSVDVFKQSVDDLSSGAIEAQKEIYTVIGTGLIRLPDIVKQNLRGRIRQSYIERGIEQDTLSGKTPDQDARDSQRLRDLGRQYSEDARRNIELWDSMGRLINPDDLNLSKDTLKEISEAMGRISHDAQQWNAVVGSIENKVLMLNAELVSARKAMRSVIQDEMNFWSGLDAPDRDEAIENILKYREKATELQNVLDIRNRYGNIDEMRKALASAREQLKSSQSIDATPRTKQDIEAGIKELDRVIKLYDKSSKGLRELQTETQKLREQMLEGWDGGQNKQNLIKYLTGIRLQLNDIDSGVPPADKIRILKEQLEGVSGNTETAIKRRQELEKQVETERDRQQIYSRLQKELETLLPLLGEEGGYLDYNAQRWHEVSESQRKAVRNYQELIEAERRAEIKAAVTGAVRSSESGRQFPKMIQDIRNIGVSQSGSYALLSAAERIENKLYFGDKVNEIVGREQIIRDFRRDMAELDRIAKISFARLADTGKEDFRNRLEQEFADRGRVISAKEIDFLMQFFEDERVRLIEQLPGEIAGQREFLRQRRNAQLSFYGEAGARKELRSGVKGFMDQRVGEGRDALWNQFVINPLRLRRELEDSRRMIDRQIEDVRANEELSAREKNERILEIEEDYIKRRQRLEEDAAIQRKRMWQDYALTVLTDIGKIVQEQAKMRIGMHLSSSILDQIPGLGPMEAPGVGGMRQNVTGGFYSKASDFITGTTLNYGLSLLADFIPGGSIAKGIFGGLRSLFSPKDASGIGTISGALSRQNYFLPSGETPFLPMGGGFDNPIHDAKVWMSGYNQSKTYARRLGHKSADDMIRYFESGFAEGATTESSNGSSGDSSNIVKMIQKNVEMMQELITAIETSEGKRPLIGDNEIAKMHNRERELEKKGIIVNDA